MKKYFTSLDTEDGMFVGSLHDPDTNKVIYKTKKYNSQSQVTSDINEYITKIKVTESNAPKQQTLINTVIRYPIPGMTKRCCGG